MTRVPASMMTTENAAQQNPHHGIGGFLQFGMLFMILSGLVWGYYTLTNKGTLVIDCIDPTVEVEVKQNGEVLHRLSPGEPVKLQAGDYELTVVTPSGPAFGKPPWVFRNDGKITIRRGELEKVKVYPSATQHGAIDPLKKP